MSELIARLVSDRDALRDNLGREVQELDSALHVARERVASLEQARRGDAERWCSCEASALEHVRTGPRGGGAGTHTALSHTLLSESCNAAHRGYR